MLSKSIEFVLGVGNMCIAMGKSSTLIRFVMDPGRELIDNVVLGQLEKELGLDRTRDTKAGVEKSSRDEGRSTIKEQAEGLAGRRRGWHASYASL